MPHRGASALTAACVSPDLIGISPVRRDKWDKVVLGQGALRNHVRKT